MTNEEMLAHISGMFEARDARLDAVDEKLDAIDKKFDAIDKKFEAIDEKFEAIDMKLSASDARFEALQSRIDDRFEAQYARIAVLIENTVTKRLDSLFDGLMLTNEKQTELEHRVESLEERVDTLEIQAS
jgi:chaperonin cofactor prefoldin